MLGIKLYAYSVDDPKYPDVDIIRFTIYRRGDFWIEAVGYTYQQLASIVGSLYGRKLYSYRSVWDGGGYIYQPTYAIINGIGTRDG